MAKGTISIDLDKASPKALVEFYNQHSGAKPITKFKDQPTAKRRIAELVAAHNELASGSSKASEVKKKEKASKPAKAAGDGKRGRKSPMTGKKLYKVGEHKKTNPRREGTHGYKSWEKIKDGMTYEDFVKGGGRNRDLAHDVQEGRIELK